MSERTRQLWEAIERGQVGRMKELLYPNGLPTQRLRVYPPVIEADNYPRELTAAERFERYGEDEPRRLSWDEIAADDAGKPIRGEL